MTVFFFHDKKKIDSRSNIFQVMIIFGDALVYRSGWKQMSIHRTVKRKNGCCCPVCFPSVSRVVLSVFARPPENCWFTANFKNHTLDLPPPLSRPSAPQKTIQSQRRIEINGSKIEKAIYRRNVWTRALCTKPPPLECPGPGPHQNSTRLE